MRRFGGARGMLVSVAATAAIAASTGAAQAQTAVQTRNDDAATVVVTGQRDVIAKDASTATKTDTPIIETPQSISVVNQATIQLHNFQDIAQAIGYSAGVTPFAFGLDPGFAQFNIRGFNQLYNGTYLDGLRLYAINQVAPPVEPYGLSELDILRGPTSVLYGQNAPGGLLNAVSKLPQPVRSGEVLFEAGDYNRYDGRFDLNTPIGDGGVAARVVGLFRQSGSQFAFVPDDETYVAPSLAWRPHEGTSVVLLGTYERRLSNSPDEFYESRLLPKGYPQTIYKGDPNYDRQIQESWSLGYLIDQAIGAGWSLHQHFRFVQSHATYAYPVVTGFVSPTLVGRLAAFEQEPAQAITVDNNVVGHVATGPLAHTLIVGVDYQHLASTTNIAYGPAPAFNYFAPSYDQPIVRPTKVSSSARQVIDQVGVYGQDQIKLGSHLSVTGSVRADWSDTDTRNLLATTPSATPTMQHDAAVSGRAGIVYLTDIGIAPYVSYATSYLPQPGTSFAGEAFAPLTGEQYEAGVRFQPKSNIVSFTVSLYSLTENNVLGPDPDRTHVGSQVSTGQERSRGVEFEVAAHPRPGITLTGAYTHDEVRVTRSVVAAQVGHLVQNVPADQGSAFVDFTFLHGGLHGLGIGAGVRYAGPSYDSNVDDGFMNRSQTYVDAVAHYDIGHWHAQINANNIADNIVPVCFTGVCNFSRARQIIGSLGYRF